PKQLHSMRHQYGGAVRPASPGQRYDRSHAHLGRRSEWEYPALHSLQGSSDSHRCSSWRRPSSPRTHRLALQTWAPSSNMGDTMEPKNPLRPAYPTSVPHQRSPDPSPEQAYQTLHPPTTSWIHGYCAIYPTGVSYTYTIPYEVTPCQTSIL